MSDGERRRVQLAMGLVRPWTMLLLDEITVDLDLLSRRNFLEWLKSETEGRECTVVYATHILDNLAGWPSHLVHMHLGKVKEWGAAESILGDRVNEGKKELTGTGNSELGELVLDWLRADLEERGPRGGKENERMGQGKTYESLDGKGGYGLEKRID